MGIELVLGAAQLAVGLVSGAIASNQQKKAQAAQKEQNNITIAETRIQALEKRRQLLREERIRRARLFQGSLNAGTFGSSGELGAAGAITTNVDTITSAAAGETKANEGINKWAQRSLDLENQAKATLAWGDVFSNSLTTLENINKNS